MLRRVASCVGLVLLAGCDAHAPASNDAGAPATSASVAPIAVDRRDALLEAELARQASGVGDADQASRDVEVRRAAARALARIGGDASRPGLLRALSDEDGDAVAWGAYGLGFFCAGHEKENVAALAARAVSRAAGAPDGGAGARLDATSAIARAIGKCRGATAEPTLVAWLAGDRDRAIAASFALADLVKKNKPREETLVALLATAAGSAATPAIPEALAPFARLEQPLSPKIAARLREVAVARLASAGEARIFAVRALGRAGPDAAEDLRRVLGDASFTASERADAARSAKRVGGVGLRVLGDALPSLVPSADPLAASGLVGDAFGVATTTLEQVEAALFDDKPERRARLADFGPSAKKALQDLASLAPPPSAPASIARRFAWLRCSAASILAGTDAKDKLLLACDVSPPADARSIGLRAVVRVLGRDAITGARLADYDEIARRGELRAREAALELLETHDEIEHTDEILADALAAKEGGVAATAADVIGKQPARAADSKAPGAAKKKPKKKGKDKDADKKDEEAPAVVVAPSPAVVKGVLDALARPGAADDPEILDSLIDAAGALGLKEAAPRLEELCRSPYPTTREHVEKAIPLVGGQKRACTPPERGPLPAELARRVRAPITLAFDSEAGAMSVTLDPTLAPVVVTRVVELARAGYYDGMIVHRVVPGFVTQLGAPLGDGFGGPPDRPGVRCETSPLPFVTGAVGVALAGRDTGSSQIFVMHARAPHLDGGYAIIGTATGSWAAFAEGDRILKVKVATSEPP